MVNLWRNTIEIPLENSVLNSDLILVRHGETVGQSSVRFYGATDIALSDIGMQQMRRAAERLKSFEYKQVITSPLRRSRDPAPLFVNGNSGIVPLVVDEFLELNFGDWEGLTAEEIAVQYPDEHRVWQDKNSEFQYPNGDVRSEFFRRVANAAQRVFQNTLSPTLAVLHKGVIRIVLSQLLGIPYDAAFDYAIELGSIQYLRRKADGWQLIKYNDTAHLGEMRIPHS